MGKSTGSSGSSLPRVVATAHIQHCFSPRTWIEGAALQQLTTVAALPGVVSVAAFPDLHPGKYGPTGIAVLSERLHPQLIGNDIGCGMSLFELDLPLRKLKVDKAVDCLRRIEAEDIDPHAALAASDLAQDLYPNALGTIGGGNHFCELQAVDETIGASGESLFDRQKLYLLVHSGSRGLGAFVFGQMLDLERAVTEGLDPESAEGRHWRRQHDVCVTWASLNRRLIAERAASALRSDVRLVADVPHNLVRDRAGGFVHHKGSAAVRMGDVAPIAGSRASLSYVVRALDGTGPSLGGISHGAGRKYDRATMHGRAGRNRSERDALLKNAWGGQLICDDRNLVIEEAASAYKDAGQVVQDLADAGLVVALAAMKPLVTYKKAIDGPPDRTRSKPTRDREGRRDRHARD
ncbi:RNA ligase RtcB family protein [Mesorhizobium sp. M00.F.Ca.ET.186.01.1.1]|nr:RNA ligase RtcB family protein [bacterium M00.F.Ca.ET.205.01.1.1]TGU55752.1 RNA ligase RtcB family protein [bacterium M00.F.Ca.ET.152.01.1.1]TGV39973.1 RNA ligase RtcB family protein [Mesorhizobium sp. M00.F.Ca.ET.186.01.1.1]TGZ44955.1 RNA ligase RtcB family protein [bacterium M00.F.Ca.ET.162.01.1.1]TIW60032.1 MAG: RNA ligase RtcB family protein [Mesorhizobium sp.]